MGLDVYLYRCPDLKSATEAEREYESAIEDLGPDKPYEQWTEEEKQEYRADKQKIAETFGLDEWGSHTSKEKIELADPRYPDHLFKIGYFRSSYNEAGINNKLRCRRLMDLSDIFGVASDEYEVVPDWELSRDRCIYTLRELKRQLETPAGKFGAFSVATQNLFGSTRPQDITEDREAIKVYAEEQAKPRPEGFGNYSSYRGEFFVDHPMTVHSLLYGKDILGSPCIWVVYEEDLKDFEWYIQALEILQATCEYVMNSDKPKEFFMHWSG